jgi:nuclear pore complex protein Nup54
MKAVQLSRNRGYAVRPEEELLRSRLETIERELQKPAFRGRLNELWARVQQLKDSRKLGDSDAAAFAVVDEESLKPVFEVDKSVSLILLILLNSF